MREYQARYRYMFEIHMRAECAETLFWFSSFFELQGVDWSLAVIILVSSVAWVMILPIMELKTN